MKMNKRVWLCAVCGFYHNLDSVCPKTNLGYGEVYERKIIEGSLGIPCEEEIKIHGKVRKKDVK